MRKSIRTRAAAVTATSVLLVGTGVAVAYWTAPGAGSGSATTAVPAADALTVVQTSTVTGLAPGVAPKLLAGVFDNEDPAKATLFVARVTAAVGTVTKAAGAPAGTCDATDYVVTDPVMTVNQQVPFGEGVGFWSGAKIAFNAKSDVNQDACKGATVTVAYTVS